MGIFQPGRTAPGPGFEVIGAAGVMEVIGAAGVMEVVGAAGVMEVVGAAGVMEVVGGAGVIGRLGKGCGRDTRVIDRNGPGVPSFRRSQGTWQSLRIGTREERTAGFRAVTKPPELIPRRPGK